MFCYSFGFDRYFPCFRFYRLYQRFDARPTAEAPREQVSPKTNTPPPTKHIYTINNIPITQRGDRMAIEIVTYGHYLGSSNPWKREFFIEATNTNGEPVDLEELVRILAETERMLSKWIVVTPEPEPWYRVRTCKYCEEIVKRRYQKKKEMFYDWWFQFCYRHAAVEFLGEISMYDNKERRLTIDLERGRIVANVCTCRHEASYFITSTEIVAELDRKYRFRYKPHTNAWPFEPSFNMVVRKVLGLVHELREILESPPRVQLYYNGELIHHP